jgi:hypothetical protein
MRAASALSAHCALGSPGASPGWADAACVLRRWAPVQVINWIASLMITIVAFAMLKFYNLERKWRHKLEAASREVCTLPGARPPLRSLTLTWPCLPAMPH